ncbi:MAG: hypothetical protein ACKN85_02905 [Pirellula sp.]
MTLRSSRSLQAILLTILPKQQCAVLAIDCRFSQFDDYEHPTGIDISDHKWLNEIETFTDLLIELVQNLSVGIGGKVRVDGVDVYEAKDLKFGFEFIVPGNANGFTLLLDGGESFYQQLD